jgi:hypothetical protein
MSYAASLPPQLRQRLWPRKLPDAIRRSLRMSVYHPGRPWYLIQSAADAEAQLAQAKEPQVCAATSEDTGSLTPIQILARIVCCGDLIRSISEGRSSPAIPLAQS